MRTIDERVAAYFGGTADEVGIEPYEKLTTLLNEVWLDAFKAGMTEAAEIARQNEFGHKPFCETPEKSILKARDSKTSV